MEIPRFHLTRNTALLSTIAIAVLGATIVIYSQDLMIVANEATRSELMSHIIAIPFLLAYLIYRKRKMLRATISFQATNSRSIIGAPLFLASLLALAPLLGAINKQDTKNLNELTKELTPIHPIIRRMLNLENKILSLRG